MLINWWMDGQQVVYPYNSILFGNKKEWMIQATAWMNLENVMLKWKNPLTKTTYCMISFIWNLQSRQICGDPSRLVVTKGLRGREMGVAGTRFLFTSQSVLKLDRDGSTTLKTIEFCTLKVLTLPFQDRDLGREGGYPFLSSFIQCLLCAGSSFNLWGYSG